MEIWKDIKGYSGLYKISNNGKIKSIQRVVYRSNGRKHTVVEKIKSTHTNPKGYLTVSLSKKGKHITLTVHQLVAENFLNHKRCGMKKVVNHIDNNKLNNSVDNLEITTNRYNSTIHRKNGSSKYVGVHFCNTIKKWIARTQINRKNKFIGSYSNEKEARLAYIKFLKENIQ